MTDNKLTIYRGDTPTISITVTDSDGNAFDLTNYTMKLTAKDNYNDSDAEAVIGPKEATISSPTTGIGSISFTVSETNITPGIYTYDVQINNGTTAVHTVVTPTSLTILEDVTLGAS